MLPTRLTEGAEGLPPPFLPHSPKKSIATLHQFNRLGHNSETRPARDFKFVSAPAPPFILLEYGSYTVSCALESKWFDGNAAWILQLTSKALLEAYGCAHDQFNVFPNHKLPGALLRSAAKSKLHFRQTIWILVHKRPYMSHILIV